MKAEQARRLGNAGRWDEAARLYQEVLVESPEDADALEGLGLAAMHGQRAAEGLAWLQRAQLRAPTNPRVLTHLGIAQKRNGLLDAAIATFRAAIELDAQPATLLNLARAEREAGRLTEAIVTFRRALELQPAGADAWSMLSNALREAGRFEEAVDAARAALSRDPALGQGHLNLGAAQQRLGLLVEAVVSYWVATLSPASRGVASTNLRVALGLVGSRDAALPPALGLVQRLLQAPGDVVGLLTLGQLQLEQKQSAAAICCFERAAEVAQRADLYHEVGVTLWGLGYKQPAQARILRAFACGDADIAAYRRLSTWVDAHPDFSLAGAGWQPILERCPDDIFLLINLGVALQRQALPSQAAALHERAVLLEPRVAQGYLNHGLALSAQGHFARANAVYRRGLEVDPTSSSIASNLLFSLHFDPSVSPEAIFAEHVLFGERFGEPLRQRHSFDRSRDPARPLRVGYVSPNLHTHPVSHFLEPVLIEHDRGQVEVFCYSDTDRPDAVTERLSRLVPHFTACVGWSDTKLAEQISADEIDILVDLAGHTGNNRLLVFARKPSPIQVSWLGYFDTTGLYAIDYRLADEHSVPDSAAHFFVERVVRLPRSSNCFLPPESPDPSAPPCLERGHVTFGCFNNPAKITRQVVAAFGRILRAVSGSQLMLKYGPFEEPALRARYLEWLAEEGISRDRVRIEGHSPLPHFLACFGRIDIALDPFPYSGETTALHTLWMGVPLVTLEGVTLVQRLGSRVLRVAGLPEWVARSEDEYVDIAESLARDPARLLRRRMSLRAQLQASPLLDHRGVTRELELAYREMWRSWCARDVSDRAARD